MKSIREGIAVFVWIAALAIAGVGSTLAQGPPDGEHPGALEGPSGRPPVRQFAPPANPFARLQLPNGDTLSFYELTGRDGEVTFAVAGQERAGNPSAVARRDVAKANPLELFNAVSQPGTPIPRQLREAFGEAKLGPQGWLLGALEPSGTQIDFCDATAFQNHIASFDYDQELVRVNERPIDHPDRWVPQNHPQFTTSAWWYEARTYNISQFFTRVAICDLDNDLLYCINPFVCVPYGPWIYFKYRDSNNQPGSWGIAFIEHAFSAQVGDSFWWLFYTGLGWDWKTQIYGAEDHEKFNIGLTWCVSPCVGG